MTDKQYRPIAGTVQFDPQTRQVNGKTVRDVTVQALNSATRVSVTLWPEHENIAVKKGDFVVAEGVYTTKSSNVNGVQRTYHNLGARTIAVFPMTTGTETVKVENPIAATAATEDDWL